MNKPLPRFTEDVLKGRCPKCGYVGQFAFWCNSPIDISHCYAGAPLPERATLFTRCNRCHGDVGQYSTLDTPEVAE